MTTAETYVTAAYCVVFGLVLAYVVIIALKLQRLERDVERLAEQVVGSSRVDLQACKLEYSIVSPK